MKEIPNDGIIMFRAFGHQSRLLITNPKALGEVLVQKPYDYKKPAPVRAFLRSVLGNGLIVVEGDEHKFQRKHIMPVFSFRNIRTLYPMMWKKAVALTDVIEADINDKTNVTEPNKVVTGVTDINRWSNKATIDIIGIAGLGREFNALKNSDDPLIHCFEELLEPTVEKLTFFACRIILPPALVNMLPWGLNERFRIVTGNLRTICNQFVREKRELIKTSSDEHLDILSVLIKSNNFSDEQLVDQLLTFIAAG
jgi:cytochrome P450